MTLTPIQEARTKWHTDRLVTFDIEAHKWTNPVALGMYYGQRDTYNTFTGGDCISKFVTEILRRKWRNHRFVAHNGGQYDFIPILEELAKRARESEEIEIEVLTKGANNSPFFCRVEGKNGKPRFLQDSLALMPRSLDSLTRSFTPDFTKGDFDLDRISKWENMSKETRDEMLDYLERDCRSLYRVLEEFTHILLNLTDNKCPPQLTVGSTAMSAYRVHFMDRNLEIQECYKPDVEGGPEDTIRKSYFGGRTEVYQKYGKDLYHYDVNSLYPYCYTRKPIPIGNVAHTGEHFPLGDNNMGGVLKINGYVPENACNGIPVLPYRYTPQEQTDERVVFPSGEIEGWYMAKEVRYAKKVGALENLKIMDSYASGYGKPFKQYGEELYDLKQSIDKEKNPGKYKCVKFLLNSFYGKFGMDRFHESVSIGPVTKEFQEGKEMINDELANQGVMLEEEETFAPYILPRIASAITSQARIEMHKWFRKIFDKGGNIWYCDTDSVVTDVELPEGEDMGEMDLEGVLDEGVFLAPKVYGEKYKEEWEPDNDQLVKAKGMKDPGLTFETYKKAYQQNEPELINAEWEGPRGLTAGMKQGNNSWFEVEDYHRTLQQFDQKRTYDGDTSKPLKL